MPISVKRAQFAVSEKLPKLIKEQSSVEINGM